jgi:uncharacterized protein YbjT (DUF2867 family)
MLLITGATGTNGKPLVAELRKLGAPLRLLTRDPAKAEALRGPGVEIVAGDLAQPESLAAALRGVERVFVLSAVSLQLAEQERAFVAAAARAGAQQLVKFSANGADPRSTQPLARMHGEGERALAQSGVPWCALRPTFFQQNLLGLAGGIKRDGVIRHNHGRHPAAHIDVRDIAAVAARVLTDPIATHAGKVYELRGPQPITYAQIATRLSELLERPIRCVELDDEAYAAGLARAGVPEWLARNIAEMAALVRNGSAAQGNDLIERIGRRTPRRVSDFLVEHRALFGAGTASTEQR